MINSVSVEQYYCSDIFKVKYCVKWRLCNKFCQDGNIVMSIPLYICGTICLKFNVCLLNNPGDCS